MGWISDRHMESGGSIGPGGLSERKKGAPLRKVVGTVVPSSSIFVPARVCLECGHEAYSWGGVRARCVACKESASKSEPRVIVAKVQPSKRRKCPNCRHLWTRHAGDRCTANYATPGGLVHRCHCTEKAPEQRVTVAKAGAV